MSGESYLSKKPAQPAVRWAMNYWTILPGGFPAAFCPLELKLRCISFQKWEPLKLAGTMPNSSSKGSSLNPKLSSAALDMSAPHLLKLRVSPDTRQFSLMIDRASLHASVFPTKQFSLSLPQIGKRQSRVPWAAVAAFRWPLLQGAITRTSFACEQRSLVCPIMSV